MQAEMLESPLNRAAQFLLSHQTLDVFSPYATRTMDMMLLERQKFSMNLEQSSAAGFLNHSDEMININTFPLFVVDDPSCESPPSIMNGNGQANNCISANNVPGSGSGWPDMDNYVKFANQYEQQSIDNSYEPQPVYAGGPALRTERKTTTPEVTLSRTISCPAAVIQRNLSSLSDTRTPSPPLSGDSLKKRKGYGKEVPSPAPTYRKMEPMRKTIKGEVVELDENIDNGRDAGKSSGNGDKEKPKSVLDIPKPDYIHVRARRGQATDSHSLAERVRREKISERMRLLQDLVPGCNKITGKAGMLDEIINYVQSLQRQVEFLSMKLAAVNRRSEGTAENGFLDKGMFTPCHPSVPNVGLSTEITPSAFHHLNLMRSTAGPTTQHAAAGSCSMELPIHINNNHDTNPNGNLPINHNNNNNNNIPSGMTLRRTTSAPVAVTDDFIQSCFQDNGLPLITPAWDFDLSNLYTMDFPRAKQSPLSSDTFTGNMETHNLKMELMQ